MTCLVLPLIPALVSTLNVSDEAAHLCMYTNRLNQIRQALDDPSTRLEGLEMRNDELDFDVEPSARKSGNMKAHTIEGSGQVENIQGMRP